MKQLTCEMCGSTNLIKHNGIFVCQDCQTKYSVEEAKRIMSGNSEPVEMASEVVSAAVPDSYSPMMENYLQLARRSLNSRNNAEAEYYCNKILETDPYNYQALLIKGSAAGWQSSLGNNRFAEALNYFVEAIVQAPDEERRNEAINTTKDQISRLSVAFLLLQKDNYVKWPDEEEAQKLRNIATNILNSYLESVLENPLVNHRIDLDGESSEESPSFWELFRNQVLSNVADAAIEAWNTTILPEYRNDCDGYPSQYAFDLLIERARHCTHCLASVGNSNLTNNELAIRCFENLITLQEFMIDSCAYEYRTVAAGEDFYGCTIWKNRYVKSATLADSAIRSRRNDINSYRAAIAKRNAAIKQDKEEREAKAKKARIEKYWSTRAEQKAQLEKEKNELQKKIESYNSTENTLIAELNKKLAAIPGKKKLEQLNNQIASLNTNLSNLGIFKVKEKKALQEQIAQTTTERDALQAKMDAEKKPIEDKISSVKSDIRRKIRPLQDRLNTIDNELTRDR